MQNVNVSSLVRLPQPLLTVYLDTNPRDLDNRKHLPAYLTWLKAEARSTAPHAPAQERKLFAEQVSRVESFLREEASQPRAQLIFAGPAIWEHLSFGLPVRNELRWGRPAVSQLLELMDEQKPCCIVAVDRAGARFFRYHLGQMMEFPQEAFRVDVSQWKRKEHTHMARRGTRMPYGVPRGADRTKTLCGQDNLYSIFLIGSKRFIEPLEAELPRELQEGTTLIAEDLARIPSRDLECHIAPRMAESLKRHAKSRIQRLLNGGDRTVLGIDETLAQIQKGTVRTVMLALGIEARLRKCVLTSRSADPACSSCGGARKDILLSESLPELAQANKTELEVVEGDVAGPLIRSGGIGGWLRRPRQAYEVPSTSARL